MLKAEIYAIAAVVGLLLLGGAYFYGRHSQHEIDEAKAEKALADANARVDKANENARSISETKDREYQVKIDTLSDRIVDISAHANPIRLCVPSSSPEASGISSSASQSHESTEGSGSSLRTERDIASELVRFAGQCEADRQQVISLQNWITSQREGW